MKKSIMLTILTLISALALFAKLDMKLVEGGSFMMSADSWDTEFIGGEVELNSFWMATYEITVDEFSEFVEDTDYRTTAEEVGYSFGFKDGSWDYYEGMSWRDPGYQQSGNHPVACISWYDAISYANWRSKEDGLKPAYKIDKKKADPNNINSYDDFKWIVTWNPKANGYRLPTEAEHEYAQRNGGDAMPYPWGDDPSPMITETNLANIADYRYEEETYDYDYDDYEEDYDDDYYYEDDYYDYGYDYYDDDDDYDDDYYDDDDYDDDDYDDDDYDDDYYDDDDYNDDYYDDYEDDSDYNYGVYDDGYAFTSPIGIYPPSDLGIYDLAGNVTEWCWNYYSDSYYNDGLEKNPLGPESGDYHSLRGSAWCDRDTDLLVSYRRSVNTEYLSYSYFGIRLVRNAK